MAKTKDAFIIRDFKDAGTEQEFTGGTVVPIEAGSFVNYEAGGLVRVPTADDKRAAAATPAPTPAA